MGIKMGPSYANLFEGYIENQFFNQYNGPQPKLYHRVGATSSTREELEQFTNSVNSFHPALKYSWQILETSIAFLDINVSIHNNGLSTTVYYKPTDSQSYLLHSSSHPTHVKTFSQLVRLRRLCSDELDFSSKSEEMLQFFKNRGSNKALKQLTNSQRHKRHKRKRTLTLILTLFTLTFHPLNLPVKNVILKNFK